MTLTIDRLREVLEYDPASGDFICKVRLGSKRGVGSKVGSVSGKGYVNIWIDRRCYLAHRLAWFWMTGSWPDGELDHEDCNGQNNRWGNLRKATRSQNGANRRGGNGLKGATWHKKVGKWQAQIEVNARTFYLGLFDSEDEAHAAYVAAAVKHFGHFARAE